MLNSAGMDKIKDMFRNEEFFFYLEKNRIVIAEEWTTSSQRTSSNLDRIKNHANESLIVSQ
jgi:hypothetical protein